ncbi:hypothetical protein IMZ48_39095 [Candidatus Bathyarchaeota archaeon]|nr:hypothetical protein [Candidatus Bathyarchaeota archaeon]
MALESADGLRLCDDDNVLVWGGLAAPLGSGCREQGQGYAPSRSWMMPMMPFMLMTW